MRSHWTKIYHLAGGALFVSLAWAGCGPGIRLGPTADSSGTGVIFSSRSALDLNWDGTPTESDNVWHILTNAREQRAMTQNSNISLSSLSPSVSPNGATIAFHSLSALDGSWNATSSNSFNIWLMNVDGSALTPLTHNTAGALHSRAPVFSPDCRKLVFSSSTALNGSWNGTATSSLNIWTITVDGSTKVPLTQNTDATLSSFTPVYSPDGSKIAFASATAIDGSWNGARAPINIWIMNSDGSGRTPLTFNTNVFGSLDSQHPVFTPDGTKIVFSSLTALDGFWNGLSAGTENIWIMNLDGTGRVALTKNQGVAAASSNPEVSPDGSRIVFQSKMVLSGAWNGSPNAVDNIWIIKPDGTGLTALTNSQTASSSMPNFSADGTSVVFWSKGDLDGDWSLPALATDNLWVMGLDGVNKTPLTLNSSASFNGTLSSPTVVKQGVCLGAP